MSKIARVEDAIIKAIQDLLGQTVRKVESVPSTFTTEEMAERVRMAPAVYVSFLGGPSQSTDTQTVLQAKYVVYALTQNARGELARRRGDSTPLGIGAYDIIELVTPALDGLNLQDGDPARRIPGAGALLLTEVANLWASALDKLGVSLYAAMFTIRLEFEKPTPAGLAPFVTFAAQWDTPPFASHSSPLPNDADTVDAADTVTLPQT